MSTLQKGSAFTLTNLSVIRWMSVVIRVEAVLILIGGLLGAFLNRQGASPVHSLATAFLIAAVSVAVASLFAVVGFGFAALCEIHERTVEPPTPEDRPSRARSRK
jgi:hypothetical protein